MAKPLRKPQPSSSVDKFFDKTSLAAALEHHEEQLSEPPITELESLLSEPQTQPARRQISPTAAAPTTARIGKVIGNADTFRQPVSSPSHARGELVDRKREFRLTKAADETMEELLALYKHSTGADLTRSHVLRAVLKAIGEAMPSLRREADGIGPLKRPSNARGYEDRRDEFEASITEAFRKGMRG